MALHADFVVNFESHFSNFYAKPSLSHFSSFPQSLIRTPIRKSWVFETRFWLSTSSNRSYYFGGVVESDELDSSVRERAIEAIDSSGRRATIGDVASKSGLKLSDAQRALQALAADTNGFLQVSDEGDILYVFSEDYLSKLADKSFRMKIEPLLRKGKIAAEYLLRVSFGIALLSSIVLVYTGIDALASSNRDTYSHGRRGRFSESVSPFYFNPIDLLWYLDPFNQGRRLKKTVGDMNFIDSVFSFVFGDGDPNHKIEKRRWKLIGECISLNDGVVTAEELAPYLDPEIDVGKDDESYILPVLLHFDGQPEVDEHGNILYCFPHLRHTSNGRHHEKWWDGEETFLLEKKWKFSKTSLPQRAAAIFLGGLNLVGVIVLGSMLKNTTTENSNGFVSFISFVYPFLQVYSGLFFVIPFVRWLFIQDTNTKLVRRNRARKKCARSLSSPDPSLQRKLLSARDLAERNFSARDYYDARDWEERFKELA